MIEVKEAVSKAEDYLKTMYSAEKIADLRLEEVVLSNNDEFWHVTFSFVRPSSSELAREIGPAPCREYKLFTINANSGEVRGMVMRNWYDGPNPPDFGTVPYQGGAR